MGPRFCGAMMNKAPGQRGHDVPSLALNRLHKERRDVLAVQFQGALEIGYLAVPYRPDLTVILVCRADSLEIGPETTAALWIRTHTVGGMPGSDFPYGRSETACGPRT